MCRQFACLAKSGRILANFWKIYCRKFDSMRGGMLGHGEQADGHFACTLNKSAPLLARMGSLEAGNTLDKTVLNHV